jgi:hypothetical protein
LQRAQELAQEDLHQVHRKDQDMEGPVLLIVKAVHSEALLAEKVSQAFHTLEVAVHSPEVAFRDTPEPLDPCMVREED